MEEKSNKKKKENKNVSKKKTMQKANTKQELKKKTEVKEQNNVEEKKIRENKENTTLVTSNEMMNLIKIVLVVSAIFLIFYGITTIVTKNKDNNNDDSIEEVAIQYNEILLGTLFEQPNSEYYVLVTKEDDTYATTYSSLISMYTTEENAIRFYTANLDNGFNRSYEADKSNINTNNLEELKLSGSTLLKIKDKKIVATYEGNAAIVEHLNNLLK